MQTNFIDMNVLLVEDSPVWIVRIWRLILQEPHLFNSPNVEMDQVSAANASRVIETEPTKYSYIISRDIYSLKNDLKALGTMTEFLTLSTQQLEKLSEFRGSIATDEEIQESWKLVPSLPPEFYKKEEIDPEDEQKE